MTDVRLTQVGVEAWVSSDNPTAIRPTQLGGEAWVASQHRPPVLLTQFGIEVWASTPGPPLYARSLLKMTGRLGAYSGTLGLTATGKLQLTSGATLSTTGQFVALTARSLLMMTGRVGPVSVPPPAPKPLFDCMSTVISQYANSPILLKLIENFCTYVDPTVDIESFYDLIWNVDTAVGYGLDVWGRIVGVTRTLTLSNPGPYFGFEEAGDAQPFGQAPFWGGAGSSSNFNLSDNAYRTLIFAKALANISDGTIPAINQLLINLFGPGNVYVADLGGMAIAWTFTFAPTPVQLAIVTQSGVLPKPVGVSATVVVPP